MFVTDSTATHPPHGKPGLIIHAAARYDFFVSLAMFGREGRLRADMLRLARIVPGESVLDVGCGTGTLAIAAKRLAGPHAIVKAVDASPEMLARAEKKTAKAGIKVGFHNGIAQALPFPDTQFDVVLATMMLHHLPPRDRPQAIGEMHRVLKPGGRLLVVDFVKPQSAGKLRIIEHLHRRHGHVSKPELTAAVNRAGLTVIETGAVGMKDIHFILAAACDRWA